MMMAQKISSKRISYQKTLDAGMYGEVFLATLDGKDVAVKKFTRAQKKEFDRIEDLTQLQHKNIVQFIGFTFGDPQPGIVMEYCSKGSLYDALHGSNRVFPLTTDMLLDWATQVATGMNYLHTRTPPIIHRDLKPKNILIDSEDVLKLTDFGEFRQWPMLKSTPMTFCGTAPYMAPELIKEEPCSVKVDVWSYGVVLWEMITGEVPYKGSKFFQIWWAVGNGTLHLEVPITAPNKLKLLLGNCWQRISKDRPSFQDILRQLDQYKGLLSVPATTSSMGTQFFIAFPYIPYGDRSIFLSNGNTVSTDVQVMSSFRGFKDVSLVIPPMSTHRIDFPYQISAQSGDNLFTREQKGISVNSKEPILVTVGSGRNYGDALLAFPSSALGTLYYPITAWRGKYKNEGCEVIAVGTEDSTRVSFTVGSEVKKSEINRLDIQTLSLMGKDLTGTRVESNKPIALYSAWNCPGIPFPFAMCASIPVHALGDRFPVASVVPEEWKDCNVYIKIVAVESDTGVFVDDEQETVIHNQGQSYRYEIPTGSSHLLTTSKPAAVAQTSHKPHTVEDASISNVASDTQFIKGKHLFRTVQEKDNDYLREYIVIITYKGNEDEMEVDGERIRGKWTEIGGSEFSFIRVPLKPGQHSVDCTDPTGLYTATLVEYDERYDWLSSRLVGVTLKKF